MNQSTKVISISILVLLVFAGAWFYLFWPNGFEAIKNKLGSDKEEVGKISVGISSIPKLSGAIEIGGKGIGFDINNVIPKQTIGIFNEFFAPFVQAKTSSDLFIVFASVTARDVWPQQKEIFSYNLRTHNLQQKTSHKESSLRPSLSTKGMIAYTFAAGIPYIDSKNPFHRLMLLDIETGGEKVIHESQLFVYPQSGGLRSADFKDYRFSHDGSMLAFIVGKHTDQNRPSPYSEHKEQIDKLVVVNLDSLAKNEYVLDAKSGFYNPVWDAEGKSIFLLETIKPEHDPEGSYGNAIVRVDLADGKVQTVLRGNFISHLNLSPNGRYLSYLFHENLGNIENWQLGIATLDIDDNYRKTTILGEKFEGPEKVWQSSNNIENYLWSANGKKIYFIQGANLAKCSQSTSITGVVDIESKEVKKDLLPPIVYDPNNPQQFTVISSECDVKLNRPDGVGQRLWQIQTASAQEVNGVFARPIPVGWNEDELLTTYDSGNLVLHFHSFNLDQKNYKWLFKTPGTTF